MRPRSRSRPSAWAACSALPLIVWQRGTAETVGSLGPGARFEPSVLLGDLRAIKVQNLDVDLYDGSFYTVAADILEHCEAVEKRAADDKPRRKRPSKR
jgi:hypothetical protein